nr:NusG domain II-containing protein [Desulforamulus aquiferis]
MKKLNYYLTIGFLGLVLLSAAGLYLTQYRGAEQALFLEIHKDGQLYKKIPFAAGDQEIKVTDEAGHYNLIEIKAGQARVKQADCPNQVCVNAGWLNKPNQITFCAPNKVKVKLTGQGII